MCLGRPLRRDLDGSDECAPRVTEHSFSKSASGSAPQLTGMKGPATLGEASWMNRASRSLPTPLSPIIRTVESTAATPDSRGRRFNGVAATYDSSAIRGSTSG
jgi:hypothetical protein